MEFASLQDAFPNMNQNKDKKKSKKHKDGFQAYELPPTDADRPAMKRMLDIPPLNGVPSAEDQLNQYLDESEQFQKKPTVNNSLPAPRSITTLEKPSLPSFFGAEPFTNPNDDMMATFNSHTNSPDGYMLESDFTKSFDQPGYGRSSGVAVPVPELRHRWKHMSSDRIESAFTSDKGKKFDISHGDMSAMKAKLDTLMARLDDLEYRAEGANPQLEMLSFIMTGLFLMFILDLTVRKSSGMRLLNVR